MFCPKCGSQFIENEKCCQNCGYKLTEDLDSMPEIEKNETIPATPANQSVKQKPNPIIRVAFFILAGIILIMSLYSAQRITAGGLEIGSIESVGGKTLEEAYYQHLGTVYLGYAAAVRAIGLFFASVLGYLGIKG